MSEVMISRRGGGGSGGSGGTLFTEYITDNRYYTVPNKIKNNELHVRIFGGGGSYGEWASTSSSYYNNQGMGGGSGWMNNDTIQLLSGVQVYISIGSGGVTVYSNNIVGHDGGTTSFGGYLSAAGGESSYGKGGNGGSSGEQFGWMVTGIAYQFGGGSCYFTGNGSNGGVWGGGGGSTVQGRRGGKGGIYGGGGGGTYSVSAGSGGTYGGNGGSIYSAAENGTNTIGMSTVPNDCWGSGECGCLWTPRTPDATNKNYTRNDSKHNCCGGGGYGGKGGDGMYYNSYFGSAAGGGGYGGNGGGFNGLNTVGGLASYSGGGYGRGADGAASAGGAGYYTPAIPGYSGGVAYNNWGRGGAHNKNNWNGTGGVCIIQYYA